MLNSDSIEYASQTDVGLKRAHNEDTIAVCHESAMAILADGMGGYNAGEVASDIAVSVIKEYMNEKLSQFLSHLIPYQSDELRQIVAHAVELANSAIMNVAQSAPQYQGMGTTLVMSVCYGDVMAVAHVGDSRAYRLRQGQMTQITHDHSVVQEQIDAGMMTEDSAQNSDFKNLVTRAVGVGYPVEVEVNLHQIEVGDLYMLCSDGLSDMLTTQDMQISLEKNAIGLEKVCSELIELANLAGGRDNISVILFRVNDIRTAGFARLFNIL